MTTNTLITYNNNNNNKPNNSNVPNINIQIDNNPPPPPPYINKSNENFIILFKYKKHIPKLPPTKNQNKFNLHLIQPITKKKPIQLTKFNLKKKKKTYKYNYLINKNLNFITINNSPPNTKNFNFQINLFNSYIQIQLIKNIILENKTHFEFTSHYIYYSKKTNYNKPSYQYQIFHLNLKNPTNKKLLIPFFPPPKNKN